MDCKRRKALSSTELLCQEEGDASSKQQTHENGKNLPLSSEWRSVLLLVVLYMLQGVPLGLSMGSMPFLMQSRVSYTQIGIFSLASYPYSFKLLWSPIVDSVYNAPFGRRKSWIVPLQLLSALTMLWWGGWVEARLDAGDAVAVTLLFFVLVLLAATQDIAVDGWALTLLSKHNLGYASTCQTVGMNCGYFTSFTIFLALSDPDFCNKHFRAVPQHKGLLTLSGYLRFWGWVYLGFTLLLALLKSEGKGAVPAAHAASKKKHDHSSSGGQPQVDGSSSSSSAIRNGPQLRGHPVGGGVVAEKGKGAQANGWPLPAPQEGGQDDEEEALPLRESYRQLWRVVCLPSVRLLSLVLVSGRLAMLPAEAAAPLKLLEKGATKEALAGLVLITFPTELVSALVAGRWAGSPNPLSPWLAGFRARLVLAGLSTLAVWKFPSGAAMFSDAPLSFATVAVIGVATSFTSTLMFTALGSFYNRISDPSMGGAYLTLLNTIANLGITLPKIFIFAAMDWMTVRRCHHPLPGLTLPPLADVACQSGFTAARLGGGESNACTAAGGECSVASDGFYRLSFLSVVLGLCLMLWLQRVLPQLQRLPLAAWRSK